MADGSLPPPNLDIAPGWGEAALARLERLAELAMRSAEDLIVRQTKTLDNAEAVKAAAAFAQASRCLRLTLTLQAKVLAGDPGTLWRGAVEHPDNLRFNPDPLDPGALTHDGLIRRAAAEVRLAFEHAISDPALIGDLDEPKTLFAETERLREALERAIERECEHESFRLGPTVDLIERLCRELGLPFAMNVLQDSDGQPQRWVVSRPLDPEPDFITWTGQGPYHDEFTQPWRPDEPAEPP